MSPDPTDELRRRGRLRWRSRRGMLELELLLHAFVSQRLDLLDTQGLNEFEALLESEDWDMFNWLQGREIPPPELVFVVSEVRRYQALAAGEDTSPSPDACGEGRTSKSPLRVSFFDPSGGVYGLTMFCCARP